ncbi:MAG: hypothetical protein JNM34_02205 [Chthonomonadaceae bacterium]|nr:hypothetical protein [Chthonomonadaceae bacterium]
MKRGRAVGCLLLVVASVHSSAQYNALNQIDPIGNDLGSTGGFGIAQVYSGNLKDASGTVIDDFVSSGGVIDRVSGAFESTVELQYITAWRISIWQTPTDAVNSSNQLDQDTLATTFVTTGLSYSLIGSHPPGWRVDIEGLHLTIPAGRVWIGMAAVTPEYHGQVFVLSNRTPMNRGGGQPRNSVGISPGGYWGSTQFSVDTDAAYAVNLVPEPASLLVFGLCPFGLYALAKRRSRQPVDRKNSEESK